MSKDSDDLTRLIQSFLKFLGSQKVAAVLMALLLLLTFLGTLEQAQHGLYKVQKTYFESWGLIHTFNVFSLQIPVPLPGGLLCMICFTINLLVGGILRLRVNRRTIGIFIIHVGIAIMMLAGLVKLKASDEGYLRLWETQQAAEYVSHHHWELAVFNTNPDQTEIHEHRVHQSRWLNGAPLTIDSTAETPFQLQVRTPLINCSPQPVGPRWTPSSEEVDGWALLESQLNPENEQNLPGMVVEVSNDAGLQKTALLWGGEKFPWTFSLGDEIYAVALRKVRYSMPYSIRLDNFEKVDHPGIAMAKEFRSDVTQVKDGDQRKIRIEMNDPLRDQGLILFQSSWGPSNAGPEDELFSVFSVVRNPSDQWPLYSCIVIAVGMAITFIQKFLAYSKKQANKVKEIAR